MNKIIIPVALLISVALGLPAYAQSHKHDADVPMSVGSATLNLGIGAGANYKSYYTDRIFGAKMALEFGIWKAGSGVITLGGETGLSFSDGIAGGFTFIAAARSAWHFGWNVPGLDTYGGLSLGAGLHQSDNKVYYTDRKNDEGGIIPVFGPFVGASYFITPRFGFNAEAGYDITLFQFGLIFKLR